MKKKAFQRGLLGFPLGVFIGYTITILISLFVGDGNYSPCVPALVDELGSEIGAVVFQAVLCGILGSAFAAASLIWEKENWSIVKQTGIYFLIASITMFPIAYFTRWMEHSVSGFLLYFGIFAAVFVFMWVIQYCIWRNKIKSINKKMERMEERN
ncbi:MAG TPA: DUF3021 domain-containing protein [Clostridiales bacterium]|nr:DUF3021 domain-containing protein [Clostridiales bacterium]